MLGFAPIAALPLAGSSVVSTPVAVVIPTGGGGPADPDRWWKSPPKKRRKAKTTDTGAPTEAPLAVSEADIAATQALEAAHRMDIAAKALAQTQAELDWQRMNNEAELLLLLAA